MQSPNTKNKSALRLLSIGEQEVSIGEQEAPMAGQSLESLPPSAGTGPRDPADNFYCIRYRVWYPSVDCAIRTLYKTTQACEDCDQGRFNLRRHLVDVQPRNLNRRRTRTLKELSQRHSRIESSSQP